MQLAGRTDSAGACLHRLDLLHVVAVVLLIPCPVLCSDFSDFSDFSGQTKIEAAAWN
jgi:hypothetical protein